MHASAANEEHAWNVEQERKMEREQEDALQTDDLLRTMAW